MERIDLGRLLRRRIILEKRQERVYFGGSFGVCFVSRQFPNVTLKEEDRLRTVSLVQSRRSVGA
jgi:hypothetical protein